MKMVIFILAIFSASASAKININQCLGRLGDVGFTMQTTMEKDLDIDSLLIVPEKTSFKIIRTEPISHALAKTFGMQEVLISRGEFPDDGPTVPDRPPRDEISKARDNAAAEEYANEFMRNNAKNYIVEYRFENKNKMQNVLLASVFISDQDCNARFNGYIIAHREF